MLLAIDIGNKNIVLCINNNKKSLHDWIIQTDVMSSIVDPSIDNHWGSKAGIDATRPAPPEPFLVPTKFPEEDMKRIKLNDYVPQDQLEKIPDAFRKVEMDD